MEQKIALAANLVGVLGALLCFVTGLARVTGNYYLAGFEAMTIFSGGIGLMVFGIFLKTDLLLRRR